MVADFILKFFGELNVGDFIQKLPKFKYFILHSKLYGIDLL